MNNFTCSGTIGEYGFKYEPQNGKTPAYHKFTIGVATDKKKEGGKGYEYMYIKCTAWGVKADLLKNNFNINDPIEVSGTLSVNTWTDNNNNVHHDLQISSANISFVPKGFNNGAAPKNDIPAPNFSAPAPSFSTNNAGTTNHGITGATNTVNPDNFVNASYYVNNNDMPDMPAF